MTLSESETLLASLFREKATPFLWQFRLGEPNQSTLLNEISYTKTLDPEVCHRWEVRYFFPYADIIIVPAIESDLFDMSLYRFKIHHDLYLITRDVTENLKIRKKGAAFDLVLKQQLYHQDGIDGFSKKMSEEVTLDKDFESFTLEDIQFLLAHTHKIKSDYFHPIAFHEVIKESMVIELKVIPVKIEFSKIYVQGQVYLSFCLESKSFNVIKLLNNMLNFNASPCSYTQFLKDITAC